MSNPPGDGPTPPEQPHEPQPQEPTPGTPQPNEPQPGYWEQQARQQGQQPQYPPQSYPPPGAYQYAPDHPKATTSLVLGILGVVLCQVLAPFAWAIGKRTLDEIDASQGQLGGRGAAQAGYVLGIVGSVLLALGIIFGILWVILIIVVGGISTTNT